MKLTVLVLFVVFVSTTFAFPKFLRGPQQTPPPPPTPTPSYEDIQAELENACGRVLDHCENPEKRVGGDIGDFETDEKIDKEMCKIFIELPERRKRSRSQREELPQEVDECIGELFKCVYDDSITDGMSRKREGGDCKDVLDLGEDKGDHGPQGDGSRASDSSSGSGKDDAGNARALRELGQLFRKIYRKK